jgi:acetyl esterase
MTEPVLDPQEAAVLAAAADEDLPPFTEIPVSEGRARLRDEVITDAPKEQMLAVDERELPAPRGSITLRLYRPSDATLPLVMFFHGGGWVIGDLDTHDRLCRRIANACDAMVISVGYRRSPEHPYPVPVEDCYFATTWAALHATDLGIDPQRIGVVGDSAGATNAAAVSLLARDRGFPALRMQGLMYPVADAPSDASPSYVERGAGYALDAPTMRWFWDQYVSAPRDVDLDDPYLCLLRADDLSHLPRGFLVTTEFDPLRDEGRRLAERLREAGADIAHHHVPDLMHGFVLRTDEVARAAQEVERMCEQIERHLAGPGPAPSG